MKCKDVDPNNCNDLMVGDVYVLRYCNLSVFLGLGHARIGDDIFNDSFCRLYELDTKKNYKHQYETLKPKDGYLFKHTPSDRCMIVDTAKQGFNNWTNPGIIAYISDKNCDVLEIDITEDMPIFKKAKALGRHPVAKRCLIHYVPKDDLPGPFEMDEPKPEKINLAKDCDA